MREHVLPRLSVVSDGRPVGVVTSGAVERDRSSALADISAAPPQK
jgi:hypothetical protein